MAQLEVKITKEEAIKLLDCDMKEFFELGKTIKELTDQQNRLKAEIVSLVKEHFTTKTDCAYKNDEYYARVSETTRPNLKKELVEKLLKVVVTNECYTITKYDTLKVDIAENYKEPKIKKSEEIDKKIIMENDKKVIANKDEKVEFNVDL